MGQARGVSVVQVNVTGGSGGDGGRNAAGDGPSLGGLALTATAQVPVTPGETIYIGLGENGQDSTTGTAVAATSAFGIGPGGKYTASAGAGGGGGGAGAVAIDDDIVLIAGGGGGAGGFVDVDGYPIPSSGKGGDSGRAGNHSSWGPIPWNIGNCGGPVPEMGAGGDHGREGTGDPARLTRSGTGGGGGGGDTAAGCNTDGGGGGAGWYGGLRYGRRRRLCPILRWRWRWRFVLRIAFARGRLLVLDTRISRKHAQRQHSVHRYHDHRAARRHCRYCVQHHPGGWFWHGSHGEPMVGVPSSTYGTFLGFQHRGAVGYSQCGVVGQLHLHRQSVTGGTVFARTSVDLALSVRSAPSPTPSVDPTTNGGQESSASGPADVAPALSAVPPGVFVWQRGIDAAVRVIANAGSAARFSVEPALPSGLSINPTSGMIEGAPLSVHEESEFQITAVNVRGSSTVTIAVSVTSNDVSAPETLMPPSVRFAPRSAKLTTTMKGELDEWLVAQRKTQVTLTSVIPRSGKGAKLARKRAVQVRKYLRSHDVRVGSVIHVSLAPEPAMTRRVLSTS